MNQGEPVTVVLGRFHPPLLALGLAATLQDDPRLRVLRTELSPAMLERVLVLDAPRVAILDGQPQQERIARLVGLQPSTGLVVLARSPSRAYARGLLATGVSCLPQSATPGEILSAVHLVASGGRIVRSSDGHVMRAGAVSGVAELTARQQEVFEYLRRGRPLAEIAEALGIRLETVRIHTRAIRRKLGVRSRAELIGMVGVVEEESRFG